MIASYIQEGVGTHTANIVPEATYSHLTQQRHTKMHTHWTLLTLDISELKKKKTLF